MRAITIANQKGGVGKTTTAVNLASGLARHDRSTLLVDLDAQGNASTALFGQPIPDDAPTVYDLMRGDVQLNDVLRTTHIERLQVLPSNINLAAAEAEFLAQPGAHAILREQLAPIIDQYDYLIIDTPPSLGLLTINALSASTDVLVPVSPSVFSLAGLLQLTKTVEQVQRRIQPQLRISGIVLTLIDRTNVTKDAERLLDQRFGDTVLKTRIRRTVKLEEAHSRGEDVFTYAPDSTGAQDYAQLVEEVIAHE